MKKFLFLATLAATAINSQAMEDKLGKKIKMHPANTLRTCLVQKGFQNFVDQTKIDQDFGNKEMYPASIGIRTFAHMTDYLYSSDDKSELRRLELAILDLRKNEILECFIQDKEIMQFFNR